MKKLLITLIGALTLGAALPVLAGPDWYLIEQARKAKLATDIERHAGTADVAQGPAQATNSAGAPDDAQRPGGTSQMKCPPDAPVLQLDHGPRAQTTPYLNRLHKERYEAQVRACGGTPAPEKSSNPPRPGK